MTSFLARTAARLALACGLLSALGPALAVDLPARKPGIWHLTVPSKDKPIDVYQCIDAATDKRMRELGESMPTANCSTPIWRREGSTVLIGEASCTGAAGPQSPATPYTLATRVTGNFETDYQVQITRTPPLANAGPALNLTAKWEGPCKAGQKPGDMIMPGGRTINIEQMMPQQQQKPR
ncbi:hypothetical protein BH09PSE6_BH09PSE6_25680 [soil metagenome]